jgi:hypothetical protein
MPGDYQGGKQLISWPKATPNQGGSVMLLLVPQGSGFEYRILSREMKGSGWQ